MHPLQRNRTSSLVPTRIRLMLFLGCRNGNRQNTIPGLSESIECILANSTVVCYDLIKKSNRRLFSQEIKPFKSYQLYQDHWALPLYPHFLVLILVLVSIQRPAFSMLNSHRVWKSDSSQAVSYNKANFDASQCRYSRLGPPQRSHLFCDCSLRNIT